VTNLGIKDTEISVKKVEAEDSYYNELFDKRTNSVKQLWRNLNLELF